MSISPDNLEGTRTGRIWAKENPLDLVGRLTRAAEALVDVRPRPGDMNMEQAITLLAIRELLLQTAAWIAQQEVDKLGL